jgi:hypothetical protein
MLFAKSVANGNALMNLSGIVKSLCVLLFLTGVVCSAIAQDTMPDVVIEDPDTGLFIQEGEPPAGEPQNPDTQDGQPQDDQPQDGQSQDGSKDNMDQQTVEPDVTTTSPIEGRKTNKVAEFSGLDKITGRIISFDVYVNETVQFGALQVTPRMCYSRPASETPKTTSFIEVDEITLDRKIRRIFTGWMFADSPGLNAVEHSVYDVWLKGCKDTSEVPAPAKPKSS